MLCISLVALRYPFGRFSRPHQFKFLNEVLPSSSEEVFDYNMRLIRSAFGLAKGYHNAILKYDVSVGIMVNARRTVSYAIVGLLEDYIVSPDHDIREMLCYEARENDGFRSCFFAVDSTTHPLSTLL